MMLAKKSLKLSLDNYLNFINKPNFNYEDISFVTLENIREIDPITLDRLDDGTNVTFTYKSSVISGTTDSTTITIDNSADSGTITANGIETINLVSTNSPEYDRDDANEDGNQLTLAATGSGSATEVVNISGAGDLTVTASNALTTVRSFPSKRPGLIVPP